MLGFPFLPAAGLRHSSARAAKDAYPDASHLAWEPIEGSPDFERDMETTGAAAARNNAGVVRNGTEVVQNVVVAQVLEPALAK
jgi:hypothetical protein